MRYVLDEMRDDIGVSVCLQMTTMLRWKWFSVLCSMFAEEKKRLERQEVFVAKQ